MNPQSFSGTMNLYMKISLLLISIVTIPTIVLGFLSFHKSNQQVQTLTDAFMLDNLQHNIQRLNALLIRVENQSERVIESGKLRMLLRQPDPADALEEYDFIRQMLPLIDELRGEYELNIYPVNLHKYPNYASSVRADADWFRQAIEREGRGLWHINSVNGRTPTDLLFVRAIRSFPQLQTVAVMTIRVPRFLLDNQLIIPERLSHLSYFVLDEANRPITSRSNGSELPPPGAFPAESSTENHMGVVSVRGTAYYRLLFPIEKNGWKLMAVIPMADLAGPVNNIQQFTWMAVAATLLIMTLLLLIIVRWVTVPIKALVRQMRKIRQGELAYCESFTDRKDEIGQLILGYNAMINGMKELIERTKDFEEEKRKLEIRSLIHQMNPHFLYNTMDTIKWKADKANEPSIVSMVSCLSNLLRFSINNGEELTTVEREMEHVRNYLQIEQMRMNEAFSVIFQIQPSILQYPFMKLTVQPLVENSVKHAMKRMKPGAGKMFISLYREDNRLVCSVEDNGPGSGLDLEAHWHRVAAVGGGQEEGVGLYNVNRRLQLKFGSEYGLRMTNRPEGGCRVVLAHPLIEHNK